MLSYDIVLLPNIIITFEYDVVLQLYTPMITPVMFVIVLHIIFSVLLILGNINSSSCYLLTVSTVGYSIITLSYCILFQLFPTMSGYNAIGNIILK